MPIRFHPSLSSITASSVGLSTPTRWTDISSQTPQPAPGDSITYIPPSTAASKKPKSGVKVLSLHSEYAIGLGLVRLGMVARTYGLPTFGEVQMETEEEMGRLVCGDAKLGENMAERWKIWAGRGRAWYSPEQHETEE